MGENKFSWWVVQVAQKYSRKWNQLPGLIPTPFFFLYVPLIGGGELVSIHDIFFGKIIKSNRLFLDFILFPLLMVVLLMKSPCAIIIIARNTPFMILVVMSHGGCWYILTIRYKRLLVDPFWKLYCWVLGQFSFRDTPLWFSVSLEMAHFSTLVTNNIWHVR